ncbi:hypothetical protein BCF55_1855 [Hydrogenivirga caldilitoris]|uniref:Uncharacterized protein n=1 Tax=Hydrogenivirga caldilitoris TaxID=246264 RepID=A0A497XTG2_9AQUI|nr:hypothetical protein BCF55_1855 [Hydrogenivirga caldilitoris]
MITVRIYKVNKLLVYVENLARMWKDGKLFIKLCILITLKLFIFQHIQAIMWKVVT